MSASRSKTFVSKPADVTRQWYVVDASKAPLGRLATVIAGKLIGKQKVTYTPHVDAGDHVIVINADQLVVTGAKADQKMYYRHSGYPGNLKESALKHTTSTRVIYDAVAGMLPKNKLKAQRLLRLKIVPGNEHPHAAQQPETLEIA